MEKLEQFFSGIINWAATDGITALIKIIIALLVLLISFKIINRFAKKIEAQGHKPGRDKTLMRTLAYVFKIGAKCIVAVSLVGFVGIDTSAITALITSLGVCFGLAVNGAVSNIAGGVLIIVTRPFKVDDYIEAQGHSGTVEAIHMTNTKIVTPDNKVVYLPNGPLANGDIVNYSDKDIRRLDLKFSIAYTSDFEKAKALIASICEAHELVLKEKPMTIRVASHSESSIDITTKVWVNRADYWNVNFDILESVKREFDKAGIEIPFNQLDVHIKNS